MTRCCQHRVSAVVSSALAQCRQALTVAWHCHFVPHMTAVGTRWGNADNGSNLCTSASASSSSAAATSASGWHTHALVLINEVTHYQTIPCRPYTASHNSEVYAFIFLSSSYFSFHVITYHLVRGLSASLPLKFGIPYLFTLGNHNHSPHSDGILKTHYFQLAFPAT